MYRCEYKYFFTCELKNYSPIHGREIDRYYSIYNNDGDYGNYFIERFKTKAEIRNELIENIIK